MNKVKGLVTTAATATAVLSASLIASPAQAEPITPRSPGCVTYSEYKRAKTGMTVKEVARLFGTKGKQSSKSSSYGITIEIRTYNGCTRFSVVSVLFTNGRLDTKSQAGL
jgi:hypothetical protein